MQRHLGVLLLDTRRSRHSACAKAAGIDRTHELRERAPDLVRGVFLMVKSVAASMTLMNTTPGLSVEV
jgi:hypothetical protein